ncbi:MAG: M10 family metallopeptidase C-terminal domain-containing protein [Candidatus Entotheonellia bacterium]
MNTETPGPALLRAVDILSAYQATLQAHGELATPLAIVWGQGETEAARIAPAQDKAAVAQQYKDATLNVFDYLQEHLGGTVRFYTLETGRIQEDGLASLGKSQAVIAAMEEGVRQVQTMPEEIALQRGDVHLAVNYTDLPMLHATNPAKYPHDFWHLDYGSGEIVSDRLANYIAMDMGFTHILSNPSPFPRQGVLDITLQDGPGVRIEGSQHADVLVGTNGIDNLVGGGGNDTLLSGEGADTLCGGAGADVFFFRAPTDSNATGADTLLDFVQGSDLLDVFACGFTDIAEGSASGTVLGYTFEAGETHIRHDTRGRIAADLQ